jgi:hypothetical protein
MPPLKGMAVSSELSTNIAIVRWVYLIQYTPQLVIPQQSPLYPIKSPYIHNVLHINIHSIYIYYTEYLQYISTLIPHWSHISVYIPVESSSRPDLGSATPWHQAARFAWRGSSPPVVAMTPWQIRSLRTSGRGRWRTSRGREFLVVYAVKAMAISYNWWFQWDKKHSINGVTS